ncbi:MAG: hypothetical protein EPO07_06935 [Verrucomicrobia bacterium]|nr:MAG: hypothetical protein EPO07_06935 [Verrucomicrobiota bacterium]
MKTAQPPTEKDRALAASVAHTVCDHLQRAQVSPADIHVVATGLASDLGKLITGRTTTECEQLFAAAVDDYLCPPSDN